MKERPILFSAPMVRALLDGSKTQTRRVLKLKGRDPSANTPGKHAPIEPYTDGNGSWNFVLAATGHGLGDPFPCPYGVVGDRLWVREAWADLSVTTGGDYTGTAYRADECDYGNEDEPITRDMIRWKPSIHMPRKLSRITLEVTGVRIERLQGISRGDAMDEGCPFPNMAQGDDPRQWYRDLWESINGAGSWQQNPWIWVIAFRRQQP